jgi:hypothetical protein
MLRVTVDIIPCGDENKARELGFIEIANDATSDDPDVGHYDFIEYDPDYKVVSTGRTTDVYRGAGPWNVVKEVLHTWRILKLHRDELLERERDDASDT